MSTISRQIELREKIAELQNELDRIAAAVPGSVWEHTDSEPYMLSKISFNRVILISLVTGNRYEEKLDLSEFSRMAGSVAEYYKENK